MRYNLDSTLPINAFSPRGGRSPFARGMTLEGGGGGGIGNVLKPVTNVLGSVAKGVTDVVKGVVQPVYNATLKQIPGVDKALVQLDKSVGKAIPGGWGTVAAVASSFIPGSQFLPGGYLSALSKTGLSVGLGALGGSGVMHGKNEFNLQGAIMGGAMAYGASQLSEAFQQAGDATTKSIEEAAKTNTTNALAQTVPSDVNAGLAGTTPTPPVSDIAPNLMKAAQSNIDPILLEDMSTEQVANANVLNTTPPPSTLTQAGMGVLSNMGNAGQGALNLTGLGAEGAAATAKEAFTGAASPITNAGMAAGIMGATGLASLQEQQKYLDSQLASGNIAQGQYDTEKAKIAEQVATANAAVSANPLKTSADISSVTEGPSLYGKKASGFNTLYDKAPTGGSTLLYAAGGNVLMNPPDDQTGMPTQTPMQNFEHGGIMSMIGNTVPQQTFASGGIADGRFLSGGGDGMSDSIHANINGSQEARLADGEFVIPADVVSHLGNGSSKAGAKQLYSMMDKVRQARVGTKKQGKQINPRKYLAA